MTKNNIVCLKSVRQIFVILYIQHYLSTLEKPEEYDATVELLGHSSAMIEIFLDTKSLDDINDDRIIQLRRAKQYFSQFCGTDPRHSFTSQTTYDIQCTLGGLVELFQTVCEAGMSAVPAYINSDVVENHFCMVRSLFNGPSDHPNYYTYKSLQNAVILTQPTGLSRKRNSDTGKTYMSATT